MMLVNGTQMQRVCSVPFLRRSLRILRFWTCDNHRRRLALVFLYLTFLHWPYFFLGLRFSHFLLPFFWLGNFRFDYFGHISSLIFFDSRPLLSPPFFWLLNLLNLLFFLLLLLFLRFEAVLLLHFFLHFFFFFLLSLLFLLQLFIEFIKQFLDLFKMISGLPSKVSGIGEIFPSNEILWSSGSLPLNRMKTTLSSML